MDHARIFLTLSLFRILIPRHFVETFFPEKRISPPRPQRFTLPPISRTSRATLRFSPPPLVPRYFRNDRNDRYLSLIFSSKYFLSPRSSNRLRRLAGENGRRVSKHRGMEKKFDARRDLELQILSTPRSGMGEPPWKKAKR